MEKAWSLFGGNHERIIKMCRIMDKIKEKRNTKEDVQDCVFTAAKAILPVMMDEYTKERERAGIIDNKAISLLNILAR